MAASTLPVLAPSQVPTASGPFSRAAPNGQALGFEAPRVSLSACSPAMLTTNEFQNIGAVSKRKWKPDAYPHDPDVQYSNHHLHHDEGDESASRKFKNKRASGQPGRSKETKAHGIHVDEIPGMAKSTGRGDFEYTYHPAGHDLVSYRVVEMTLEEKHLRLVHLENIIREHLGTGKFFLVAAALRDIDAEKLYEPEKTIYVYAKNRFQFSRRTTNTYLCSASVYESIIEDPSLPVPANISHIRSLHKFPPEIRRFIWKQVCDSGLTITEEHVVAMTVKYETGVSFSDLSSELYTPKEIIQAAKQVIGCGCFDLDPATCHFANDLHANQIAREIYDEALNGLNRAWKGHVWLSPPQGCDQEGISKQSRWFFMAEQKYLAGEITSCFVLLKVDLGNSWFDAVTNYPHCFFASRLIFLTPTGREKILQDESHVIVYLGQNVDGFCVNFGPLGTIPGYNSWSYKFTDAMTGISVDQQTSPQSAHDHQQFCSSNGNGVGGSQTKGNHSANQHHAQSHSHGHDHGHAPADHRDYEMQVLISPLVPSSQTQPADEYSYSLPHLGSQVSTPFNSTSYLIEYNSSYPSSGFPLEDYPMPKSKAKPSVMNMSNLNDAPNSSYQGSLGLLLPPPSSSFHHGIEGAAMEPPKTLLLPTQMHEYNGGGYQGLSPVDFGEPRHGLYKMPYGDGAEMRGQVQSNPCDYGPVQSNVLPTGGSGGSNGSGSGPLHCDYHGGYPPLYEPGIQMYGSSIESNNPASDDVKEIIKRALNI
ncbi:uncharacterized protein BJ171DRAFT_565207 [Polychytrium aggregatum]|uniref:uncharacterized protein n=1 Tax=Polychytrium aggregatum TaxID=110093 RepID=UPI0022FE1F6D|nr:uncharacterized protein BJ171DRAFT_565207 [Polychytrium aggregatum]KAI9208745.1 hypothetical protein BJ171DRAFT_565207 [Polychytrium aggregatum]